MHYDYTLNLSNLKKWDIVFALVNSEGFNDSAKRDHCYRPFLIIDIDHKKSAIYGYELTSVEHKRPQNTFHKITPQDYNLKKDSYIIIDSLVKIDLYGVLMKMDSLNLYDQNEINCKLFFRDMKSYAIRDYKDCPQVGDVIFNDKDTYFIYKEDKKECYGYPIGLRDKNILNSFETFTYNGSNFFLDFDNPFVLTKEECQIAYSFPDFVVQAVLMQHKQYKYEKKKLKKKEHEKELALHYINKQ